MGNNIYNGFKILVFSCVTIFLWSDVIKLKSYPSENYRDLHLMTNSSFFPGKLVSKHYQRLPRQVAQDGPKRQLALQTVPPVCAPRGYDTVNWLPNSNNDWRFK
jgi:hypothetical protein